MYGPRSTTELYNSSESLSQWLNTGQTTQVPKKTEGRNALKVSASSGNLLVLPGEKRHLHGSTLSVNSIPAKLPKRPTPRPSVTSLDFGSPRPSVTSLDMLTIGSLDDLGPDDLLTAVRRLKLTLLVVVSLFSMLLLVTLAMVSASLSISITQQALSRKPVVAAHLLINTSALQVARDHVKPIEMSPNMSSCERAYELSYWHSVYDRAMLYGVAYNEVNNRLTIMEDGIYSVYSQVVFDKKPVRIGNDPFSDSLIHVLCRAVPESRETDEDLAQATTTPNKVDCTDGVCTDNAAFHTSHVIGVARLYRGDELYVKVSNLSVIHLAGKARVTFVGLFKIN